MRYRTLVVDPPWSYNNTNGNQTPDYAPRMMSLEAITAFPVARLSDDDAHLYLWVTDTYAGECYPIVRRWGFEPKTTLVWLKKRMGMGNYYRHAHELCVFAVKGTLPLARKNAETVFEAPITRHSEKPAAFYRLVESCSPGPYADIFARRKRPGWDVLGDEVTADEPMQLRLDGRNECEVIHL